MMDYFRKYFIVCFTTQLETLANKYYKGPMTLIQIIFNVCYQWRKPQINYVRIE